MEGFGPAVAGQDIQLVAGEGAVDFDFLLQHWDSLYYGEQKKALPHVKSCLKDFSAS
jgi:hypothetical protein